MAGTEEDTFKALQRFSLSEVQARMQAFEIDHYSTMDEIRVSLEGTGWTWNDYVMEIFKDEPETAAGYLMDLL